MPPPLRRALSATASSARLRRGLSTAASRPSWAMIYHTTLVNSSEQSASLQLAKPPCASHLLVPAPLVHTRPRRNPDTGVIGLLGVVRASSADGFLLLDIMDGGATAPIRGRHGTARARQLTGVGMYPDIAHFVCNPLSGELFRLPIIEGAKKTMSNQSLGLLVRSEGLNVPDRYAVSELSQVHRGEKRSFVMRRFLSETGRWDRLVGLLSPLPLGRRMNIDHEVLAFAGRLWWVDVSWGAVSADPFSDRPDLRFVELPSGSVTEPVEGLRTLGWYRRMGASEGKLRYVEVSQKEPFVLRSFTLDDDGSCWTLEHHVALNRCWKSEGHCSEENTPRIGVIDPLNASAMHITTGNFVFAVDLNREKVFGFSVLGEGDGPSSKFSGFLKPCVLPSWLESSQIPSAGKKEGAENKTLGDVLVCSGRD